MINTSNKWTYIFTTYKPVLYNILIDFNNHQKANLILLYSKNNNQRK